MDAQRVEGEFVEIEIELREGKPALLARIAKELERAGARIGEETPKLFRVLKIEPRPSGRRSRSTRCIRCCASSSTRSSRTTPAHGSATIRRACTTCGSRSAVHARSSAPERRSSRATPTRSAPSCNGSARCSATSATSTCCWNAFEARRRRSTTPTRAAAGRLLRTLARQRTRARRVLLKALDGQRYADLLDLYEATLEALEPSESGKTLGAARPARGPEAPRRRTRRRRRAARRAAPRPAKARQANALRARALGRETRRARTQRPFRTFSESTRTRSSPRSACERSRTRRRAGSGTRRRTADRARARTSGRMRAPTWRKAWRKLERSTK